MPLHLIYRDRDSRWSLLVCEDVDVSVLRLQVVLVKEEEEWRMSQSHVMMTNPQIVLPVFVLYAWVGIVFCLKQISHQIAYYKLEIQSDSCHYLGLMFYFYLLALTKSEGRESMIVFLHCNLPLYEESTGLSWTKAPSRCVANGLTKHDKRPLLHPTLHSVKAFVLPKAAVLDHFENSLWLPRFWIFWRLLTSLISCALHWQKYCSIHLLVHVWPKYPCSSHPSPWPAIKTHHALSLSIVLSVCIKPLFINSFAF